jgi:ATP-dependent exoDNAse (exonuclease V) beta subunit
MLQSDKEVHFEEKTHTYTVEGNQLKSVTAAVGECFEKFDATLISKTMANKHFNDPESKYYQQDDCQIREAWKEKAELGSKMHKAIEKFLCDGELPDKEYQKSMEWVQFQNFMYDHRDWKCVASELRKFKRSKKRKRDVYGFAGTIDAIFKTPDGYVIVDWKRCEKIRRDGFRRGKDVMVAFDDCNFNKYSLQLSCYVNLILGQVHIKDMYIVQFHPTMEDYRIHKAISLHMEAGKLLE